MPKPNVPSTPVPVMLMCPVSGMPGVEPCRVTAPPAPPMRLTKAAPSSEICSLLVAELKYSFPWPAEASAGAAMPRRTMAPLTSSLSPGAVVPRPVFPLRVRAS